MIEIGIVDAEIAKAGNIIVYYLFRK